jgi:putative sterol carrier protein
MRYIKDVGNHPEMVLTRMCVADIMSANHIQEDKTMAFTTLKEVFENMVNLPAEKIEGLNTVILFDLSGDDGGKWTLKLEDGKVAVEEGETESPAMTLSMSAPDFIAMSNGELNAMQAFMQGKIKIAGDMGLAMKLQNILG